MKSWFQIRNALTLGLAVALLTPPFKEVQAQPVPGTSFQGYLQTVAARARSEGVSEATITQALTGLTENQRVVELDRQQPGRAVTPPAVAPYLRTHVDAARINRGRAIRAQVAGVLPAIESRYGVPNKMLIAIWGHETNYGSYTGDFDLVRSLATLAYEGRRRDLFEGEFIAVLKMLDRGVPRARLKGSWAGAFGNPQFLPSVYLRVAQDGDGDGFADIWASKPDTLASIANYFRDAGWRAGEPWGVAADVTLPLDRPALGTALASPRCPQVFARHSRWKTVREWKALGVVPRAPTLADDTLASLLEPDGPGQTAYLLTGNYRVILDYNCSNFYALSVGLLADEISR
jgi:lytic murein transglycosylase